jgi:prepilin-type N-terminal cleavage/methylation domain-containing protein
MNERGFTLIEISVSVAILGAALGTLIVLHTRMLNAYVEEQNAVQGSFFAQYLMTVLEAKAELPEPGTKESSLEEALEEAGYFSGDPLDEKAEVPKHWTCREEVTSIDLPLIEDALRRIDLSVSWGLGEEQSFNLVYFLSTQQGQRSQNPLNPYGSVAQR